MTSHKTPFMRHFQTAITEHNLQENHAVFTDIISGYFLEGHMEFQNGDPQFFKTVQLFKNGKRNLLLIPGGFFVQPIADDYEWLLNNYACTNPHTPNILNGETLNMRIEYVQGIGKHEAKLLIETLDNSIDVKKLSYNLQTDQARYGLDLSSCSIHKRTCDLNIDGYNMTFHFYKGVLAPLAITTVYFNSEDEARDFTFPYPNQEIEKPLEMYERNLALQCRENNHHLSTHILRSA